MPRGFNPYRVSGDVAYLALTDRYGLPQAETLIDAADLPRLETNARRWNRVERYAGYWDKAQRATIYLQRFLTAAPDHLRVHHLNGNPLDNRRANLRVTTPRAITQRHRPTLSGFRGVSPAGRGFKAQIAEGGQLVYLGLFLTPAEAAAAYNAAALRIYGPHARLNSLEAE